MIGFDDVVPLVDGITVEELRCFIEMHWINPEKENGVYYFAEIDIARTKLVWELRHNFLVEEESVSIILSLLDQLYFTRRQLRKLLVEMKQNLYDEDNNTKD